ncbi:helix-turn-helix domain-containing protein [Geodermatophilus sp. URMC 61]|uniref:helix-turn-helix domain-containing protein n=1 Tax=Geodermatophilus sp. URMC 61 TaxID=3423411 RepID=UPI00406D4340
MRGRGLGVWEIARRLGRAPSTACRELRRNLRPHDQGIYDGDLVQARVRGGPRRPRRRCRVVSLSCGGSCRASSRRSGAVRRSPRICGKLIRSGRLGPVSRGHPSSAAPRGEGDPSRTSTRKLRTGSPAAPQAPASLHGAHAAVSRSGSADRSAPGRGRAPCLPRGLGWRPHRWPESRSTIDTLVDRRSGRLRLVRLSNGHGDSALTAIRVPGLGLGRPLHWTACGDRRQGVLLITANAPACTPGGSSE